MKKRSIYAILLTVVFLVIAVLIKLNKIIVIDDAVYNFITFNINKTLTIIHKVFTFFGSTMFIIALTVFLLILFIILKKKEIGFTITTSIIISTIVNNVIKLIIQRPRPIVQAFVTEKSFSFPSGHTMASTTLYGICIYLLLKSNIKKSVKIIGTIILGILPILVAISRIYLGAHFFSDVFGGYICSIALLLVETIYFDKKLFSKDK